MNRFGTGYTPEQVDVAAECVEVIIRDGVLPVDLQLKAENLGINTEQLEEGAYELYHAYESEDDEDE